MSNTVQAKKGRCADTPNKTGWFINCSRGQHDKCKNQNLNKHGESCKCICHITVQQEGNV